MEQKKSNLFLAEEMHLNDAQMNIIQGGGDDTMHDSFCSCGCQGPSSTADNKTANINGGKTSPGYSPCDSIFKRITVTWEATV